MRPFKYIFRVVFIVYLATMSLYGISHILWKASAYYRGFKAAQFNYDTVREKDSMPGTVIGIEARNILPNDAVVKIVPQDVSLTKVAIRYHLFPVRVGDEETHVLDLNGPMPFLEGEGRGLPKGARIYAKSPHGFVKRTMYPVAPSIFRIMIFALVYSLWLIFVGSLSLSLMNIDVESAGRAWFMATSYLLGCFIFTALVWLYLLGGGVLGRMGIFMLGGVLSAALLALNRLLGRQGLRGGMFCFNRVAMFPLKNKQILLGKAGVLVLLTAVFIITVASPVRDWDGMSIWIMKAKVIFHNHQLVFNYTYHNYYPILWPLNVAIQFELLGGMFDEIAQWTSAMLFLAAIVQVLKAFAVLGLTQRIRYLMTSIFIVFAFQNFFKEYAVANFVVANAANILLAYLCATVSAILMWLRDRRKTGYMALSVLLMCGLNLSKLEGGVATLFLIISLCLLFLKTKTGWKEKAWIGLSFLTILFPLGWIHWIKICGYGSNIVHFQTSLTFAKSWLLLCMNFRYFFMNNMILLFMLSIVYLVSFPNKRKWNSMEKFLLSAGVLFSLFACLANAGLPENKIVTAFPEAFPRLFLRAAPFVFLLLGSRFFSKLEEEAV